MNKHIATEMQSRLGNSASASTLHSLGFAAIRRACPGVDVEEGKPKRLLQTLRPKWFWEGRNGVQRPDDRAKAVLELSRLAKMTLTDAACADDMDALVDHFGVETDAGPDTLYVAAAELLEAAGKETKTTDYDDMIWLPVVKGWAVGGFDTLFVDEGQDLNRCQQMLARRAGSRLVLCGDTRQALYGFSGSDCDSLPRMVKELSDTPLGCLERPLTVTFRCPRTHVALARHVVAHIEAAEHALEGSVNQLATGELTAALSPGDMVICRRNAPLVDLVYKLLGAEIPAVIKGRDVGQGLLDLVKMLKPVDTADLGKKLHAYAEREQARLERKHASEQQMQSLQDRVTCLGTLASRCAALWELEALISSLFADDAGEQQGRVILSSVHRAKGLEANRVVILEPEKLPMIRRDAQDWERVQELNLLYVALTRSKRELIFAGDVPAVCRNGAGAVALSKPLF